MIQTHQIFRALELNAHHVVLISDPLDSCIRPLYIGSEQTIEEVITLFSKSKRAKIVHIYKMAQPISLEI